MPVLLLFIVTQLPFSHDVLKFVLITFKFSLKNRSIGAAAGFMPDDSKGEKEIYRIEDFEPVSFPHTSSPNIFFFKNIQNF